MLLLLLRSEVDEKCRHCAHKGSCLRPKSFAFTAPLGLVNPMTRTFVTLLGPCFKTGRRFRRPTRVRDGSRFRAEARYTSPLNYPPDPEPADAGQGTSPRLHHEARSRSSGSTRKGRTECCHQNSKQSSQAIAGQELQSYGEGDMNRPTRLRDNLRLPLNSFTYS